MEAPINQTQYFFYLAGTASFVFSFVGLFLLVAFTVTILRVPPSPARILTLALFRCASRLLAAVTAYFGLGAHGTECLSTNRE